MNSILAILFLIFKIPLDVTYLLWPGKCHKLLKSRQLMSISEDNDIKKITGLSELSELHEHVSYESFVYKICKTSFQL